MKKERSVNKLTRWALYERKERISPKVKKRLGNREYQKCEHKRLERVDA